MAITELDSNPSLLYLTVFNASLVGLAHAFGFAIIKYEDAVLQTTITLTIILTTWLFFLFWPFEGHEDFNFFTLCGMTLLGAGSYLYVMAKKDNNEEHELKLKRSFDVLDEEEESELLTKTKGQHSN